MKKFLILAAALLMACESFAAPSTITTNASGKYNMVDIRTNLNEIIRMIDEGEIGAPPATYPAVSNNAMNAALDSDTGTDVTLGPVSGVSSIDMDSLTGQITIDSSGDPIDLSNNPLSGVSDPIDENEVGDRGFNDNRYLQSANLGTAAYLDEGTNSIDLVSNSNLVQWAVDTNDVIVASSNAVVGSLGTMAFEASGDYAAVITNTYTVTTPTDANRTFNPADHKTRHILSPYHYVAPAAFTANGSGDPANWPQPMSHFPSSGGAMYYYANNEADEYIMTVCFNTNGIDETYGANVRMDVYYFPDSTLDDDRQIFQEVVCATNAFITITNEITDHLDTYTNGNSAVIQVLCTTPSAGVITNFAPVWIMSVEGVGTSETAEEFARFLLDAGASAP